MTPLSLRLKTFFAKTGFLKLLAAFGTAVWTQAVLFGFGSSAAGVADALVSVVFLTALFWILSQGRAGRVLPAVILSGLTLAHPVAQMAGPLATIPNIETLFGTSVTESLDFLLSLSTSDFLRPIVWAGVLGAAARQGKTWELTQRQMCLTAGLLYLCNPVFLSATHLDKTGYFALKLLAAKQSAKPMTWRVTGKLADAKPLRSYVLVMGESLRRDAMSLYGNPLPTTPYLDSRPARVLDAAVSPAGNTMAAVPRILSLTNAEGEPEPQNNVVALVRAAGFETFWISSQKRVTNLTLPFAVVAESAEHRFYTTEQDDELLLKPFEEALEAGGDRQRFIVLHTYGSHEPVCHRVAPEERPFSTGIKAADWKVPLIAEENFFDCYLASALKADRLIERLVKALEARGESWSLVFTSDHAASFFYEGEDFKCCRYPELKALYEVPFVEIGSEVRKTERFTALRSTSRFADWFPTWIGMTTERTEKGYDIFRAPSESPSVQGTSGKPMRHDDLEDSSGIIAFLIENKEKLH